MSTDTLASLHLQPEMGLGSLLSAFRRSPFLVLAVTLSCGLCSLALAFMIPPTYRAEVVVVPVNSEPSAGGLGALAGQFGGLAALAGVNLGSGGDKSEGWGTLSSRALIQQYIQDNKLLPALFPDKWDSSGKRWKASLSKQPTLWDGTKLFTKKIRYVSEDKKNGLITLSIEWKKPEESARWANDLVRLSNSILRERAITRSQKNIDYLNAQLEKTSVIELRQSIYRLLESEIKNVMVAKGSDDYAFRILDPAVVPQEKAKPKRSLIVLFGIVCGLSLGLLAALYRQRRD